MKYEHETFQNEQKLIVHKPHLLI